MSLHDEEKQLRPEPGSEPALTGHDAPIINVDEPERPEKSPTLPRIQTDGLNGAQPQPAPITIPSTDGPRDTPDQPSSRPPSNHNVSSPQHKASDSLGKDFLAVPGTRSRGSSLESSESQTQASYGGETYISSAGTTAESGPENSHSNSHIINDKDALRPDPQNEAEFKVDDNRFAFTPGQLNKMINPKNLAAFYALGGLGGIEKGLRTNRTSGLSTDEMVLDGNVSFEDAVGTRSDNKTNGIMKETLETEKPETSHHSKPESFSDRKRIFKDNRLPQKKSKTIWELAWMAYNDKILILLSVAAVISLALGLYQALGKKHDPKDGANVEWVEGLAIIVAIIIVVIVGAANDWQKERQFVRLNRKKEERFVRVIRSGKTIELSVYDVLAGDVMHLEPGDLIPVDGIFIDGHDVKCDESSATGESDIIRKTPSDQIIRTIENNEPLGKMDPFILSGGKVTEGVGTFLVTSVGVYSSYGKTMMSLQDEGQTTPLQSKLNILAEYIAKLGLAAGLLLFLVLFIKFLAQLNSIQGGADAKGDQFLKIFIVAVTIIVVAVPEGLPLAVTLALAFATTRMIRDNNLVRLLRACETMGNATTICSDKTGTLTQNKMSVVTGSIGTSSRFDDSQAAAVADGGEEKMSGDRLARSSFDLTQTFPDQVKELLKDSIALNSTAFEAEENGEIIFRGSKTETSLLDFAKAHLSLGSIAEERANAEIVQMVPFDSGRKCMAVVIKMKDGRYRMLVKGASEIMIARCTRIIKNPTHGCEDTTLSGGDMETLQAAISQYASRSLRTIGLLYRDYEQWPPRGAPVSKDDSRSVDFDKIFKDMVFLGIVGIQDPLRPGVTESVRKCQIAGVFVRMVTGDNIMTAKAIATECGIFTPGGIAMEGPVFRRLSSRQMTQIVPRLQVLARSSPEDKRILVKHLRKLGETVAVTGDGTNDAPALKAADVGFSMGIAGTEVAKEASAIILMDDNFNSIVKAVAWGRAVNDAVKKFLQFQITVNITAVLLTFVSAVASESETSVLKAVQLLWVNLIMDTFAALALATDPPTPSMLKRKPEPKSAPLITLTMWKMIIGQSIYQLVVCLILNFRGLEILSYTTDREVKQMPALIFNTFVFMQIFNQYNARRLDNNINIFEGIHKNWWFIGIQFIIVGGQVMIIFIGGQAFAVTRLNGAQWGYSIILGLLSIPVAVIIRLIPDELVRKLMAFLPRRHQSNNPSFQFEDEERIHEWNPALEDIRQELTFLKKIRGGRMSELAYKLQHPRESFIPRSRSASHSRSNSSLPQTPNGENQLEIPLQQTISHTPEKSKRRDRSRSNSRFGPAAAMAGIIAGSVAGGWSPVERGPEDSEPITFSSSQAHGGLDATKGIELHPGTSPDDPVIIEHPEKSRVPPSQNPALTPRFSADDEDISSSSKRDPDHSKASE